MKTLLVVEDEKMIRRGICTIAKRSGVPIETILECSNGLEALETIKNNHVDVMFTDIRMPKMDGIELVHAIKDLPNKPLVVAISGYDDFSFAVEMLKNGVRDYILKPVDREKIYDILTKLEQEIQSEDAKEKTEAEMGKQRLRYLLTNELNSEEEIDLLKNKFDTLFFAGDFVVVCSSNQESVSEFQNLVEMPNIGDHNVYLVEKDNLEDFLETEMAETYVGISDVHKGIENVRTAYKEAIECRKKAFCLKRTFRFHDPEPNVNESLKNQAAKLLDEQELSHRLQLIGTGRTDELIKQWDKLFIVVERMQITEEYFEASMEHFIEAAIRLYRSSMDESQYEKLKAFRHTLAFASIQDYQDQLMDWILTLNEKINAQEEDSLSDQKMKKAIAYIKENYNADINMAVVSNYVSMNYSLFSYSFKQYTGTNFVNYLKQLRVEAAKSMLAETDMKVIEISNCVGYDNEKHFMKLFKACCGVSPSEYRKNMKR